MSNVVHDMYGNKLRIRVCGICVDQDRILLVDHISLGEAHFWAPPGGGVELMESSQEALIREFGEETGLIVEAEDFQFACELIKSPLHAIELFFRVSILGGELKMGADPEAGPAKQIITSVRWHSWKDVEKLPATHLHGIFKKVTKPVEILDLRGYFKL